MIRMHYANVYCCVVFNNIKSVYEIVIQAIYYIGSRQVGKSLKT